VVCTDLLGERCLCCRQTSTRFIGDRWQIHDKSILGAVFMEFVACCSRCSARPLQRKVKHFCNQIYKRHMVAPLFFHLSNVWTCKTKDNTNTVMEKVASDCRYIWHLEIYSTYWNNSYMCSVSSL